MENQYSTHTAVVRTIMATTPKYKRYRRRVRDGEGIMIDGVEVRYSHTPGCGKRGVFVVHAPPGVLITPLDKQKTVIQDTPNSES